MNNNGDYDVDPIPDPYAQPIESPAKSQNNDNANDKSTINSIIIPSNDSKNDQGNKIAQNELPTTPDSPSEDEDDNEGIAFMLCLSPQIL